MFQINLFFGITVLSVFMFVLSPFKLMWRNTEQRENIPRILELGQLEEPH